MHMHTCVVIYKYYVFLQLGVILFVAVKKILWGTATIYFFLCRLSQPIRAIIFPKEILNACWLLELFLSWFWLMLYPFFTNSIITLLSREIVAVKKFLWGPATTFFFVSVVAARRRNVFLNSRSFFGFLKYCLCIAQSEDLFCFFYCISFSISVIGLSKKFLWGTGLLGLRICSVFSTAYPYPFFLLHIL